MSVPGMEQLRVYTPLFSDYRLNRVTLDLNVAREVKCN